MKKKFTFVNQNYEMLNKEQKPIGFTYSSENIEVKPRTQKMYRYTVIIIAFLALLVAAFFYIESMKHSERGKGLESMGAPTADTGKQADEQLRQPGMPADFKPEVLPEGTAASYTFDLIVPQENKYEVRSSIDVTNTSEKAWSQISFYFFPNQLGDMARDQCRGKVLTWVVDKCLNEIGTSNMELIGTKVNGQATDYEVEGPWLNVPLRAILPVGANATVEISYSFSLPNPINGERGHDLLQWHPMLPDYTYDWIIQPPAYGKETYSAAPANYHFRYKTPGNLMAVTSATDLDQSSGQGELKENSLKEMHVLLLDGYQMVKTMAGPTEVRVFAQEREIEGRGKNVLGTAVEAVGFFSARLGESPHKQIDIVLTEERKGSYPGIVLQPAVIHGEDKFYMPIEESQDHLLVHQLAQQWFYGKVHFDRYKDAWLNDGLSELAASLFFFAGQKKSEEESFAFANAYDDFYIMRTDVKSNLPADKYIGIQGGLVGHVQAKPVLHLWKMMKPYGTETALDFLSDYLSAYSAKKLATIEFIRFTKAYFKVDNQSFAEWLDFNPYENGDFIDFFSL
ncbi:hypothetical protein DRW41_01630 [Neobacillus piezotolerans]|uniref:Peptidase M1 membrane alanine aminopeptidase domain-containing protein n=1 Tax=Neobacillus piezotolerans TaxID=2259171 RepID=A0A3D8GW81_9BACI|nr:hypothetical protein [Neobacillus piezotolerans]RDU38296.1 hypothetical protein DRW41_01630 [Neobacillus piezotolerans]